MEWKFTDHPQAVVVEICSNPVNKQNPAYFEDVNAAFNRLDRDFPGKPIILTAKGKIFSAGIDFDYCLPMFAKGGISEVAGWFGAYRQTMMRIFTCPRMTIAALNGHAFAGGLILALSCDFRVGTTGESKFAVNEVPIGIPMPSVYTELLRFRVGNRLTSEMVLLGKTYNVEQSQKNGILHDAVSSDKLIETALAIAGTIHPDCWPAYSESKKALLYPVLQDMTVNGEALDRDTYSVMVSPSSVRMHKRVYEGLKKK